MKRMWIILLYGITLFISCRQADEIKTTPPLTTFPELFPVVQESNIFPDSKTFTDCIPKESPGKINKLFKEERKNKHFDLRDFVTQHFIIPASASQNYTSDKNQDIKQHIDDLWHVLLRSPAEENPYSSLIRLPHPYIVPGGRFREIYYWDSYFTMLGLKESKKTAIMRNMVNNFAWLIRQYGFIPNGNRTYYLTRSQPPYFSMMVQLLAESLHDPSLYLEYLPELELEYKFWMKGQISNMTNDHIVFLEDKNVLNRYYDTGNYPREEAWNEDKAMANGSGKIVTEVYRELRSGAESGWDFSSRWMADPTTPASIHITDIIPVDLNCLLYNLENVLSEAYQLKGNKLMADKMRSAAVMRKQVIQQYLWDTVTGCYYDYDFKKKARNVQVNAACVYPLLFHIAREGQTDSVSVVVQRMLLKAGGIVTSAINTGQQWDAPNGWAPLQWTAYTAFKNYHYDSLAQEIATRWLQLNIKIYKKTGRLMEKYNVVDTTLIGGGGEYPNQDGFGWTNGVFLNLTAQERKATPAK